MRINGRFLIPIDIGKPLPGEADVNETSAALSLTLLPQFNRKVSAIYTASNEQQFIICNDYCVHV